MSDAVEKYKEKVGFKKKEVKKISKMSKKDIIYRIIWVFLFFLFCLFVWKICTHDYKMILFKGEIISPAFACQKSEDMAKAINTGGQNAFALVSAGNCWVEKSKLNGIITEAIDLKSHVYMYLFQARNRSFYVSKKQVKLKEIWENPHDPSKAKLLHKCRHTTDCIITETKLKDQ